MPSSEVKLNAVVSLAVRQRFGLTVLGDFTALLLVGWATVLMLAKALDTRGQTRTFFALFTAGCFLWFITHCGWVWIEVIRREPLPDPFLGDIVLFIHIVPFMAAVALRPHRPHEQRKLYFTTLNFVMLLLWWVFLYLFIVFPDAPRK